MQIAIIDIGTNTTRLFIAEVSHGRLERELARISRVTRLGAGVDATGRLAPDALEREHAVLEDYREIIARHEVKRTVAVMTSAVRDAADGDSFAADVAARYGVEATVLSGEQEATLTYRGATDGIDPQSRQRILVVDIGGGSTELVLGHGIHADFHVSTQAGVVRQSDRHLSRDPPPPAELAAVGEDVRATLEAGVPSQYRVGVERTLAVAGTPVSLAAIDLALGPDEHRRVHGHRLSRKRVEELLDALLSMSAEQRRTLRGLHPDRASVIIPGASILLEVMALFDLAAIEVCVHDLLRGAALRYGAG